MAEESKLSKLVSTKRDMSETESWIFSLAPVGVAFVFYIMFIIDIANNLFQHVFNGDQAGNAAVLVDNDGHVVAAGAEIL